MDGDHITDHARLERAGWPEMSRVSAIALEAAAEAVPQAGWAPSEGFAIVACTSKGPIEDWIRPAAPTSDNPGRGGAADPLAHGYGMSSLSAILAHHFGVADGPHLTLSAACAGGLQALVRAALLIRAGEARRVLVVAAEASVHPLFLASFRRLGVLPPAGQPCRPFDVNRSGFLMSESAAAICLEAGDVGGRPLARLTRFATGGDAVSLTGSDPDAATLSRLIRAVSSDRPFDLVHAHGTGTNVNDAAELTALHRNLPNGGAGTTLFSHKAAIGHTLGASGLVSAVLNVLAHLTGAVPPNVNTSRPMSTVLRLLQSTDNRPIEHSLIHAAGFGGGITTVSISSP